MRTFRIGAGAGFAGDRIEPAVELAQRGQLDYLVFECLAERTISVIAFDEADYPLLGAPNFVMTGALGGGVTRSLALDAHGKGLSSALLDLDLPGPDRAGAGRPWPEQAPSRRGDRT